jgi:hypothetical protein
MAAYDAVSPSWPTRNMANLLKVLLAESSLDTGNALPQSNNIVNALQRGREAAL